MPEKRIVSEDRIVQSIPGSNTILLSYQERDLIIGIGILKYWETTTSLDKL